MEEFGVEVAEGRRRGTDANAVLILPKMAGLKTDILPVSILQPDS